MNGVVHPCHRYDPRHRNPYKGDYLILHPINGAIGGAVISVTGILYPVNSSSLRHKVYDDLCAPAVWVMGDTMLVFGSTYTKNFPIWMSTDPKANQWKEAVDSFDIGGWDPDFFPDDDGKLYMYNGSSNRYPLYGVEINRKTLQPIGTRKEMYLLEDWRYGWQRFGEYQRQYLPGSLY